MNKHDVWMNILDGYTLMEEKLCLDFRKVSELVSVLEIKHNGNNNSSHEIVNRTVSMELLGNQIA